MISLALTAVFAAGPLLRGQPSSPPPVGEAIVHRTSGVVTLILRNGVPLHVKPMPGSGRVVIVVNFLGADAMEGDQPHGISRAAGMAWRIVGENDAPAAQGDRPRARAWSGPDGLTLRLSAAPGDVGATVSRLAGALSTPTVSGDVLDRWKSRMAGPPQVVGGGGGERRPSGATERLVADAVLDLIVPHEQARRPWPAAGGPEVTAEQAGQWLNWCIRNLPVEAAIAGEITPAEAARVLAPALLALPMRPADVRADLEKKRHVTLAVGRSTTSANKAIPSGQAYAVVGYPGPDMSDLEAMRRCTIGARIAAGRLPDALRRAGLKVGPASVTCLPGRGYSGIGMIIGSARIEGDAEDAGKAQGVIDELLRSMATDGPTEEEIRPLAEAAAKDAERRLKEPDYWATILSGSVFNGVSPDAVASAPATYQELTPAMVASGLGRFIVPGRAGRVLMVPLGAQEGPVVAPEGPSVPTNPAP